MTPLQYLNEVVRVNPDDYVDILSYMQEHIISRLNTRFRATGGTAVLIIMCLSMTSWLPLRMPSKRLYS